MFDKFVSRHVGTTDEKQLGEMLATIGVGSVEELIGQVVPASIRLEKPLALGQGMCGSVSGSVPNEVGQPLIRISSITVGGRS